MPMPREQGARPHPPASRRPRLARPLEAHASRVAVPYAGQMKHPCRALAKRWRRPTGERFACACAFAPRALVRRAGLDADNNRAARLLLWAPVCQALGRF